MNALPITITPAGFAALINPDNTATRAITITQIGISDHSVDLASVQKTLPNEIKRLTTFGGRIVARDTLHLSINDTGNDHYSLRSFGLYLSDGTLFAVYSQPDVILEKSAQSTLLLVTDIRFTSTNISQIQFGSVEVVNPPASDSTVGVMRVATIDEHVAGTATAVATTPQGVRATLDARLGNGAPSDWIKSLLTSASAAVLRTAIGLKAAALKDEGDGKGLDADLLDGQHGSYYRQWVNLQGVPSQFPPSSHTHVLEHINGLTDALNSKVAKTGDTLSGPLVIKTKNQATALDLSFETGRILISSFNTGDGLKSAIQSVNEDNTDRRDLIISGRSIYLNPVYGVVKTIAPFLIRTGVGLIKLDIDPDQRINSVFSADSNDQQYQDLKILAKNIRLEAQLGGSVISTTGYSVGSARALKTIDGPLPYGVAEIAQLATYVGRYKSAYNPDQRQRLFLDAEQLMGIIPEAVNATGAEFEGKQVPAILMDQLLPVLVKAIGDLSHRVKQLEATVQK